MTARAMRRAALLVSCAAFVVGAAAPMSAQNPPAGAPPQQGRGGGGRGRAVQVMTLTSSAFADGARIPVKYAQPGAEVSPPLTWTGAPAGTRSFVLLMHDVDAAVGTGLDDVLHWLVWNIPATATGLAEGIASAAELADDSRQISVSGPYYRGPAAPANGPMHHYLLELFALDTIVDVAPIGASPAATRTAVMAAMAGRVRGKGVLVGVYRREQ